MKKIGVFYGAESEFPERVIEEINSRKVPSVRAEAVKIGGVRIDESLGYNVIFDRVSNKVPFYQSVLKLAILEGTKVVNNPFVNVAADNFLHGAIANKLKIAVPKTAVLPSKERPTGAIAETLRNLIFPLNWDEIFESVGFPAYIKPNVKGSSHIYFKVYNESEFFSAYDLTGQTTMILQEAIEYDEYYRCYAVGKKNVLPVGYDPRKPRYMRFNSKEKDMRESLKERLISDSAKICEFLGLDFNVIEFAVKDGVPYAVEFMNPEPAVDQKFLSEENFRWLVKKTSEYLINLARERKIPLKKFVQSKFVEDFNVAARRGRKPKE